MFVSDILAYKGDRVISVAPQDGLAAAIAVLAARRIGAVLVLDAGGAIAGILSERDVLHAMARDGAAAITRKVSEVMTAAVVTCDPDDSIEHVMETMTERRFRHLPVVRQGRLCGMISIGDVVRLRLEEQRREADALREYITAA
ncbi:MAG: CBS domain-containing protein [Alphaproteobacteria bacterium]|nr:CBS domain-containing protein [Alphaproteobacteria bacterium]